jgi:hypothetical protein
MRKITKHIEKIKDPAELAVICYNMKGMPEKKSMYARIESVDTYMEIPYMGRMMKRAKAAAEGPVLRPFYYGYASMSVVYCKEHKAMEVVPAGNFNEDLRHWYEEGLHPRYSVLKILLEHGYLYFELNRALRSEIVLKLMRKCKTAKEFKKEFAPHALVNLYWRGRKYRVPAGFKERYKEKKFTAKDFLKEDNQERRRLILNTLGQNGIDTIKKSMTVAKKDKSGEILVNNADTYLHVQCPSTKEHYLLQVPGRFRESTPLAAKKWTFDLPPEARFMREA